MTSPQQRSPRSGSSGPASRGLILVGVAVVLGFIVLAKGGGVGYEGTTKAPSATTAVSTSTTAFVTSTAAPAISPAEVKVIVANGSGQTGLARTVANSLKTAGFTNSTPTDAVGSPPATTVYFAQGYETNAQAIGTQLQLDASRVQALPAGASLAQVQPADAGVIVVLGQDASATGTGTGGATATTIG